MGGGEILFAVVDEEAPLGRYVERVEGEAEDGGVRLAFAVFGGEHDHVEGAVQVEPRVRVVGLPAEAVGQYGGLNPAARACRATFSTWWAGKASWRYRAIRLSGAAPVKAANPLFQSVWVISPSSSRRKGSCP